LSVIFSKQNRWFHCLGAHSITTGDDPASNDIDSKDITKNSVVEGRNKLKLHTEAGQFGRALRAASKINFY